MQKDKMKSVLVLTSLLNEVHSVLTEHHGDILHCHIINLIITKAKCRTGLLKIKRKKPH